MILTGKSWAMVFVSLAAAGLAGCLAGDDPQGASTERSEQQAATALPHCIGTSVATPVGKAPARAESPAPVQCFATFSQAIFAATGGRVRLPDSAMPAAVDDRTLNGGAVTNADFVIGIEYVDINHQGGSFTVHNTVTCDGFTHSIASLSPFGWNDVFSSAFAFSNCNNSFHYENDNFGGAVFNCFTNCNGFGAAMNDRTSSLFWTN